MARGGYGAARILPILDELTVRHGPPPRKLLVGYSDVTVLHEYVRSRWRWQTLHAPMPAASDFSNLPEETIQAIFSSVRIGGAKFPWEHVPLKFFDAPPNYCIDAELTGGNLTLWTSLVGTAYQPVCDGKIIFLEDLGEAPYRIDRYITQIDQSGGFDGCVAIILGDFSKCDDEQNDCLMPLKPDEQLSSVKSRLATRPRVPLRKTFTQHEAFCEIFGTLSRRRKIPVAYTLPVGHGPNFNPLPLGVEYRLSPDGRLELPFRGERLLIEN
jgi:muramoyltetrapeptide carboxypeptidase LdcA involved in peptidoglycan recycling